MITKNGNWWTPVAQTSGRPGDYLRDEYFPCVRPINIATELCTQRRNAIDVGTWIGDSTVHMASLFDRVIGFEPHPMCFVCCEKNLKARDIENTELYNIALSNVNETKMLLNGKTTFSGWVTDKKELPKDIKFAYLPNLGRVRLRLSSKGINEKQIHAKIDKHIAKLLPLIKDIFVVLGITT